MRHSWFGASGGNLGAEVEMEYNHMFANAIASKAKNLSQSRTITGGWNTVGIWMKQISNDTPIGYETDHIQSQKSEGFMLLHRWLLWETD